MTLDEILEYGDKPVQPPSIWGQDLAPQKRAEAAGIAQGQPDSLTYPLPFLVEVYPARHRLEDRPWFTRVRHGGLLRRKSR